MSNDDDDIPVLTDAVERDGPSPVGLSSADLERLEARITAATLAFAEERLRAACREAEHVLIERVMNELRAELPAIVSRTLDDLLRR